MALQCQLTSPRRRRASFFFGEYKSLRTLFGGFSNIYFRGLGLTISVIVWVMVKVRGIVWVKGTVRLGLVWCYGQGMFRVRVRIRVRVGFELGL